MVRRKIGINSSLIWLFSRFGWTSWIQVRYLEMHCNAFMLFFFFLLFLAKIPSFNTVLMGIGRQIKCFHRINLYHVRHSSNIYNTVTKWILEFFTQIDVSSKSLERRFHSHQWTFTSETLFGSFSDHKHFMKNENKFSF